MKIIDKIDNKLNKTLADFRLFILLCMRDEALLQRIYLIVYSTTLSLAILLLAYFIIGVAICVISSYYQLYICYTIIDPIMFGFTFLVIHLMIDNLRK